jgi:hypothetical protein
MGGDESGRVRKSTPSYGLLAVDESDGALRSTPSYGLLGGISGITPERRSGCASERAAA